MKRNLIIVLALVTFLSSCDFIRSLAGRPTSEQLDQMRLERMAKEEARHQATLDSMAKVQQHMADSLAAQEKYLLDSLVQAKGTVLNPSKLGGLYTTKLETKYCIVVGAFRNRSNAERKLKECNKAGFTATIVSFRNGLLAVAVCPSDSLAQTLKTLKELRGKGVCPPDTWILVNE